MIARLLTLALTETTRQPDGYDVTAWDITHGCWVIIVNLPMSDFRDDKEIKWDIFAITEADILVTSGEYRVLNPKVTPRVVDRVTLWSERKAWLDKLCCPNNSIVDDIARRRLIGLIRVPDVSEIQMMPKDGYSADNRMFYWQSRILFRDTKRYWSFTTHGGVATKDMRWKKYWWDVGTRRSVEQRVLADKWVRYMNTNFTYFIVRYYETTNQHFVVAGLHCLPNHAVGGF